MRAGIASNVVRGPDIGTGDDPPHGRLCELLTSCESRDMPPTDDLLAARLRALLTEHGLTQAEVGRRTGICGSTLNRIVHGKRRPNAREIGALAHVLEVELLELLGVTEMISTLVAERDELAQQLGVAKRAVEQRAAEVDAANVTRGVLLEQMAALRGQLDEFGQTRASAEAELESLRSELAAARDRIALLEKLDELFPSKPGSEPRPFEWEVSVPTEIALQDEMIRERWRIAGRVFGTVLELGGLLWSRRGR